MRQGFLFFVFLAIFVVLGDSSTESDVLLPTAKRSAKYLLAALTEDGTTFGFTQDIWQQKYSVVQGLVMPITTLSLYAMEAILCENGIAALMQAGNLRIYNGALQELEPSPNLDIIHVFQICYDRCILRFDKLDEYWEEAGAVAKSLENLVTTSVEVHFTAVSAYGPTTALSAPEYEQLYMLSKDTFFLQVSGSMLITFTNTPIVFSPTPEIAIEWNNHPDREILSGSHALQRMLSAGDVLYLPSGTAVRIAVSARKSASYVEMEIDSYRITYANFILNFLASLIPSDEDNFIFRKAITQKSLEKGDYIVGKYGYELARRLDAQAFMRTYEGRLKSSQYRDGVSFVDPAQKITGLLVDMFATCPLSEMTLDTRFRVRPGLALKFHPESAAGDLRVDWRYPGMKRARQLQFPDRRNEGVLRWLKDRTNPFTVAEFPQDATDNIRFVFLLKLQQSGVLSFASDFPWSIQTLSEASQAPLELLHEAALKT
eukprot:Rmarinus@m.26718